VNEVARKMVTSFGDPTGSKSEARAEHPAGINPNFETIYNVQNPNDQKLFV
jgi:hypothetical protein